MAVVTADLTTAIESETTRRSLRRLPVKAVVGGVIIGVIALLAILAPLLPLPNPDAVTLLNHLLLPGKGHLLGTDQEGRDILSRLIWGARASLAAAMIPVLVAAFIGAGLGVTASLAKRRIHNVIMRALDVIYAFPHILLAIAIAAALGPGITNAVLALTVIFITPIARITETEVNRIRSSDFIDAARAGGASKWQIALYQIFPNILPTLLVYCTSLFGLAIVFISGLSFLGLGEQPPAPEWGAMLADLRGDIFTQPALVLIPAAVIFLASAAFNLLGDGLRDFLDVRSERTL